MSRKIAILAGVVASGLGVAAIVNAQNATQSRAPTLSDRFNQIRDGLVGRGDDDEQPAAAPSTNQRHPTDWSAGRKFGVATRPGTRAEEIPEAPRHNIPAPNYNAEQRPARRSPPPSGVGRTNPPNRSAPDRAAADRSTATTRSTAAPRTPIAERAPVQRNAAHATSAPLAVAAPSIAMPTETPRAATGGVSADSPLKNRLQALRDENFDSVAAGGKSPVGSAPAAVVKSTEQPSTDATASTDSQWRPAAPAAATDVPKVAKVETPVASASESQGSASRYSNQRMDLTENDAPRAVVQAAPPASANDAASVGDSSKAGRYGDARVGEAPNASTSAPSTARTTERPPTYVARRDAIRPGLRDNAPGAAKVTDDPKSPNQVPSITASPSALLASKSPVLSVKTIGPKTITIGKPAKYELLLENSGDAGANEVLVTVKLPAWAQIEGAQATAGSAKAPSKKSQAGADADEGLQWRVSRLDAGSKQRLVMQIVPRQSTPFQLAVQWTFEPEVTKTVVEVQEPKLQIALDGPKEVLYGANEMYRITLSNPGTGDAENVSVLTSTAASPAEGLNKLVVGTLAAGATKTLELKIAATQAGTLHVVAKATADGNLASQAAADVLVRRAALKLAAAGPQANYAGTQAVYEVRVANPGNATAENVRVEAALPIGARFDKCSAGGSPSADGTKVVWSVPSLAAGSERAFELTCTLMAAGANRLQVAGSAAGQLSHAAEVSTRVEALADLKLEVADPRGPVAVGADAAYEVRIRNRGTKSAERINVVGFFSEGVEPVSATGMKYTIETGQITFATIDALDPNQEVVVKVIARAAAAGNHVFRAELVCESTETRLVVEEATKYYADEPAKPAAFIDDANASHDGGVRHAGGAFPVSEPHGDEGVMPGLAPPSAGEGELQPLDLLDEQF